MSSKSSDIVKIDGYRISTRALEQLQYARMELDICPVCMMSVAEDSRIKNGSDIIGIEDVAIAIQHALIKSTQRDNPCYFCEGC